MNLAGKINPYEKAMIQRGVVFNYLKMAEFGIRDEVLKEREYLLKNKNVVGYIRPESPISDGSNKQD